jgi:serine protease
MKRQSISLTVLFTIAAAGPALAGGPHQAPGAAPSTTSQIVVKLSDYRGSPAQLGIDDAQLRGMARAAGISLRRVRAMSGDARVLALPAELDQAEVSALAERIATLPGVAFAVADRKMVVQAVPSAAAQRRPNDPLYRDQWHYKDRTAGIGLPGAWRITVGDPGVHVAVIDTGILGTHEDLDGQWTGGYDFISNESNARDGDGRDPDPSDEGDWSVLFGASSWHGSHVAGTIGAATNNNIGVAGIAFGATLQPVRVLGRTGGTTSDIVDAMRWSAGLEVPGVPANPNPARAMNLSLGGAGSCDAVWQEAIDDVMAAGAVVLVAAGNEADDASLHTPSSCDGAITVGSVDRTGDIAWYSNFGPTVEISAPGGDTKVAKNGVLSTLDLGDKAPAGDTYGFYQGTSMATPHVTGVVALMFSVNPALTPKEVIDVLQWSAKPFPAGTKCAAKANLCGAGILNATKAVKAARSLATSGD